MDSKKDKKEAKEKKEKKAKKEPKEKSSSKKNLQLVKTSSSDRAVPAPTGAPNGALTPSGPASDELPDMAPILKLEPHRGVLSLLEQHAKEIPNQQALVWCEDRGKDTPITYGELWRNTRQIVHILLKKLKLGRGDRVVLLFEPGLEFIHVCLGCFGAGVVAVPMYPPLNVQRDVPKIMRVLDNCKPKAILVSSDVKLFLTTSKLKSKFTSSKGQVLELPSELVHEVAIKASSSMENPIAYDPNGLALLQYTSGSTGDPKGVMLTHSNVTHNICAVAAANGLNPTSRFGSWQPMYHDMGLMGMTLLPIRQRVFAIFMSPVTFITNPSFYVEKCSQYKIQQMAGPNFAFGLMARKWPAGKKCDLSSIKHAVIAAEKIVPATLEQFNKVFGPYGFKNEAWTPMYGLAENTVLVASKTNETVWKGFGERVSCGVPQFDIVVKIVNPETCEEVLNGEEGEIWVDGPSKAAGYWGAPERSDATFRAVLKGDTKRAYLRTGDLGRMYGRELTVSGRIKEIVIIRGKKYHPEDIEGNAFDADTKGIFRPGSMVACSYETSTGEEELAIVAEVREEKTPTADLEEVAKAAMSSVAQNSQIQVSRFVIIPPRVLPKTSSGKLQRIKTRDMLAKKEFKVLYEYTQENAAPQQLQPSTPAKVTAGKTQKPTNRPTANFTTIKAEVDLYAAMRMNRTIPQCCTEAQKFCDGVSMTAPVWSVSAEEGRRRYATVLTPSLPKLSVLSAANVFADGRNGQIPLRLFRPDGSLGKTLPVTFFFHGGGWVFGGLDTHDYFCRDLCRRAGTAIVAVEYRLSPENKFPVPLYDCIDAVNWCVKFSRRLNLDPKKAVLCGESAGANLAVAAALLLRDEKAKRQPSDGDSASGSEDEDAEPEPELGLNGIMLMYPPLDAYMGSYSQLNYPAFGLPRDVAMYFRDAYIKLEEAPNPLISVVYADLKGLPPVHMINGECDPVIDECTLFVQKLKESNVNVTHRVYAGQIHGFATLPMQFPTAVGEVLTDTATVIKGFHQPASAAP